MRSIARRCADSDRVQRWAQAHKIKRANGWLTIFWLLNFPPAIAAYLALGPTQFTRLSLLYVVLVSIWANVAGHFSAWVAGRVEVKQEQQMEAS